MAPHSSTLAWKIPWVEEPGGPQSMGSLRVGQDSVTSLSLFTFLHWRRQWQPTPVFLPGESQGWGSLVGCRLWGHTESDTTEVTQQQQQQQHFNFQGLVPRVKCFLEPPQLPTKAMYLKLKFYKKHFLTSFLMACPMVSLVIRFPLLQIIKPALCDTSGFLLVSGYWVWTLPCASCLIHLLLDLGISIAPYFLLP